MTDQERHAFFDRLAAAIEGDHREEFERWRLTCEALPKAELEEDALSHASAQAAQLAATLSNAETEDVELALTAALHAFHAHRCLHRIAERGHGAP